MHKITRMLKKLELIECVGYLNKGEAAHIVGTERFGEFMVVLIETESSSKAQQIRTMVFQAEEISNG